MIPLGVSCIGSLFLHARIYVYFLPLHCCWWITFSFGGQIFIAHSFTWEKALVILDYYSIDLQFQGIFMVLSWLYKHMIQICVFVGIGKHPYRTGIRCLVPYDVFSVCVLLQRPFWHWKWSSSLIIRSFLGPCMPSKGVISSQKKRV